MEKFRLLTADDIECRIGTMKGDKNNPQGVSLLLYKDARCDMAILDETVGPLNWQRLHEFKEGKLYCTVSIYDSQKMMWIDKEDVGVESNTEAEKGQASDSFKRACVNWGIGRELYTAPFIWVNANPSENIRYTKFTVKEITYDSSRKIASLVIVDEKGMERYRFPRQAERTPTQNELKQIIDACKTIEDIARVQSKYGTLISSDPTLKPYANAAYKKLQGGAA